MARLPKNRLSIDYLLWLKARGLKQSTIEKEIRALGRVFPKKHIEIMTSKEIINYFAKISDMEVSDATKYIYKNTAKNLFKMKGRGHEIVAFKTRPILRKDRFVTLREVQETIKEALHTEDKLFLKLLWEGCFRRSELINLQIKNIRFDNGVAFLRVEGKTGERTTPIMRKSKVYPLGSYGLLKQFMQKLPANRAYLFSYSNPGQIDYLFKKLRAGTGSRDLHAHLFRKSRATYLDQLGIPIQHIRLFGGWSLSSMTVLRTYVLTTEHNLVEVLKKYN